MFGTDTADNQTANTSTSTTTQDNAQAPVFGVDPVPQVSQAPSLSSDESTPTSAPEIDPILASTLEDTPTSQSDSPTTPTISIPEAPEINPAGSIENSTSDLMELKKEALAKLGPLVDKLDQGPEEKFKTTMMMIQASDDKALIPKAYDAANMITDEKIKAQALLDIINEINYFTNQNTDVK